MKLVDYQYYQLCKTTYEIVIKDKIIDEREEILLRKIHKFGVGYYEGNVKKILMDIKRFGEKVDYGVCI